MTSCRPHAADVFSASLLTPTTCFWPCQVSVLVGPLTSVPRHLLLIDERIHQHDDFIHLDVGEARAQFLACTVRHAAAVRRQVGCRRLWIVFSLSSPRPGTMVGTAAGAARRLH